MQKIIPKNIPAGAIVLNVTYCVGEKLMAPVVLKQEHYRLDRHKIDNVKKSLSIYLKQGQDLAAELGSLGVMLTPEGKFHIDCAKPIFDNQNAAKTNISQWPLLTDMREELF